MCVLFIAVDAHPAHRLVFAGNRDEAHARPTVPLAWWADAPDVAAGRDLEAGGTWLGVTRAGRWATVTNVREPASVRPDRQSRGTLVADFLCGDATPGDFAQRVQSEAEFYNGFNLLVGDAAEVWYASTRRNGAERLQPGVYGLSNDALDTPWPKVTRGRARFENALRTSPVDAGRLLDVLHDETAAPDAELPGTGVGLELERVLSPLFIVGEQYGTRASTAVVIDYSGAAHLAEQTWGAGGTRGPLRVLDFDTQTGL